MDDIMDDIYDEINQLSSEKRELLELLISESQNEFNCFPLSFAQQRLWFVEQLNPNTSTYNMFAVVQLSGLLNVTALHQSLNEIVQRHETLRTSFVTVKGQPMQIVATANTVNLPIVDLRELPQSEQKVQVQRLAITEAQRPFDLARDLLLRVSLLLLGKEEHVLLLTMHHIISDGWSMGVLVSEIAALYKAFSNGRPSPLPPLPIQYVDFAYWQEQWLQGEVLKEQLAYWQQQLGGNLPVLELPTDHQRLPVQSYRGARQSFLLPADLSEALKALSLREEVTLFMTLLAAFKTLLYHYTGQEDILVGSPIANRNQAETEKLIGLFINTLVLRTNVGGNPPFLQLLAQVRKVVLGAYTRQDLPFEKLVETLQLERDLSRNPLFQVMFILQNAPMPALEFSGLTLTPLEVDNGTAKFDLTLELLETPNGIRGWLEYNTDLFDGSTICRMAGHFQTLLENIAVQPETPLADLPMLLPDELHWLCHDLNATTVAYPQTMRVHELVEQQVKVTPNQIAVVCGEYRMTYQTLDERANQLAHYLRTHGVQANTFVGLCLPPSLDMVVGLLAILKAGGAYVPIDPTYPEERMIYMMQDSGIDWLLSHMSILARFNHLPETVTVVCLDDPTWIARVSEEPNRPLPPLDLTPDRQLMYAIYTSGSTGRPKAAQVYHRGAVNLLDWYSGRVSTTVPDCVLLISSLSFDLTQKNIWSPLMLGGTLMLMDGEHYDADRIIKTIKQTQVTRINCTPSVFYPLVEHPTMWPLLSGLRQVYLGGESIVMSRLQAWYEQSTCELINSYGPTECTDVVSYHVVQPGELNPPIGRPINNMELYVLNKRQSLTPLGSVGELCIGGDGVGAGYLGRAELTAEKFITHPFKADKQQQLYRTGDLARYLSDGTIEYLGRMDDQVKIRGFRIELGEIEQQITQLPSIKDSVVLVTDNASGISMLVAYVTLHADYTFDEDAIKTQLAQSLPDYMMPTFFVALDQLPLTPNGKVNKQVLLQREYSAVVQAESITPRNDYEQQIHDIFCEVLGLDAVSVTANFFDLGGHSLLATQVVSRLRRCYTKDIPVALLFEQPTVSRLAKKIAGFAPASTEERNDRERMICRRTLFEHPPLSYAQQRLWFLHQLEPTSAAYNIFGAFRVFGGIDMSILQDAIQTVVARHEILRTTFSGGDTASQTILDTLDVPLYAINLQSMTLKAQTLEIDRLMDEESNRPFNLAAERLIRFTLISLGAKDSVLLINLHHIIADGWSMSVLIQEITHLYRDREAQHKFSLPDLPIQYADYAQWQQTKLQGEYLQMLTDYWTKQLAGDLSTLELPVDFARAERSTNQGGSVAVLIDTALTDKLQALCKREGVSLFMLLYTTYCVLLNRVSLQDDIIVGSPIAGRCAPETEALLGCFVNTLVLRLNVSGTPTFKDLLLRAKNVCIGAYEHQEMPFDKLVEILRPDRSLNQNPIFSVMINLVNTPSLDIQIDGLKIEEITQPNPQSKLALTLYAFESESQLDFKFVYQKDLYSDERMVVFAEQFAFLLAQVADSVSLSIPQYSLVTPTHHQLLPNPKSEIPIVDLTPLPDQLQSAMTRFADNKALLHHHRHYTYRELGESSRAIAIHLVQKSVSFGEVIAVFGERSFSLVSSMVAVLSANGVLMTIDKNTPEKRRRDVINESGARTLIVVDESDTTTADVIRDHDWQRVVRIDPITGQPKQATGANSKELVLPQVSLDDPAYVFFTSGTTGKPRGILGQHKGLSQFLSWQQTYFSIDESDRAAQLTSLNFDVVLRDIFLPLISGATLCLPDQEDDLSAATLFPWFQQQRITYWHTVPTIVKSWLSDSTSVESLPNLRRVFFAGEPLPSSLVLQWRERISNSSQLVNLYGPTETTLAKAFHIVEDDGRLPPVISVGTAIPGTQLLVINADGALCGIGEQGEIAIRTRYASLGYLDSGWSLPKFQINGNPDAPNDVTYFTGDIGYYRPDGHLCIAGRLDDQIKIRGIRIELGEIQAVVNHHPQVKEVALTSFVGTGADKRIAAYYVTDHPELDSLTLRGYVKERLHDYMVPSVFIQVSALPFTLNGKLDRRKLPDPLVVQQAEQTKCYVPPTSQLEETLVSIWTSLLDSTQVGIDDNFFDLGGHSLLLMQVKSRLKEKLSLDVPVIALFQHPTIRALARYFNQENEEAVSLEKIKQRVSRRKSALQHRLKRRLSQS